ncbi:hypothetical protein BO70DRAFT_389336 [Aspergillus heteromorphus CBS 117.55]|uniref:Trichothecene 3-O-acetyltransferase-like N-terminal domain-containing protein n=1 Tax=Aspergillus heteromorphus CBS 117.55 TaxID=1448321 RepID=A0A317VFA9_9EURO|nr:uncharacterized protein BO70DRAFT_389336 [Aspergillus heteromorphus CBS 117.55]PWY73063.1 hypothetical protein BO70DRAFT_389336 [Aspergillus heteromorphus CBS 117.55]
MGSYITDFCEVPTLTPLERIGPKGYVRYIFPFPLAEGYDLEEVTRVLRASYAATKQRLAVVGCEAVPDQEATQAGVLKLRRLEDGEIEDVVVQDLRAPGAFPTTYAKLQSQHFPVASLDAETLCRRSQWPSAGERLPVSLVQANFIPGGLLLNWCTFHMVGDGTSYHTWMKIWAEECRRAQGLEIATPIELPDAMLGDRERIMQPSGRSAGLLEDHRETHRGQVFYFSPAALQALKADASPVHAREASDQPWISTNDALAALLWRTVMAVQWPLATLEGDPVSVFNIAIDGRLRTDPPVHPETLGCFLEYLAVSAPIREIVGSATLADLAIRIRRQVRRADRHFTDDVVTLADRLEDVNRLVPTAFLDVPGFNCVLTSWINFQLYELDWGASLGHRIDAVRLPHCGLLNGTQLVLPVPPEGGLEVLLGVDGGCLDRLLQDQLWMKYAVAR